MSSSPPSEEPPLKKKRGRGRKKKDSSEHEQEDTTAKWEHGFFQLAVYKANHGELSCMPKTHPLYEWVRTQRRKANPLTDDQKAALNAIGFSWHPQMDEYNALWEKRYQELVKYKEKHGHTTVPTTEGLLGRFVSEQRIVWSQIERIKMGTLDPKTVKVRHMSAERKQKLDAIDFVWTVHTKHKGWEGRFQELKVYKEKYGNCLVPQHWPTNKTLGKWVARQRYMYSLFQQGKRDMPFTQEKLDRLDAIGFDWGRTRPKTWKETSKEPNDVSCEL